MKQIIPVFLLAFSIGLGGSAQAQGLPDGTGRATYENVCGACHGADIVIGSQGTRARWEETVDAMRNRGAAGSDIPLRLLQGIDVRDINVHSIDRIDYFRQKTSY